MKCRYILLVFLFCFILKADAQVLFLYKKDKARPIQYFKGAEIAIEKKGSDWMTGTITGLTKDSIFTTAFKVHLDSVAKVKLYRKNFNYRSNGIMLMLSGAFFSSITTLNGLGNQDEVILPKSIILVSSGLSLVGLGVYALNSRTFTIAKGARLVVLD